MSSEPDDVLRRELWELILRYKNHLSAGQVFTVEQREGDRRQLHSRTTDLQTTTHRILDSKAYLQLSTMQEEAGRKFLAAGVSPRLRLKMLSRLIAGLATPVLSIAGRSPISFSPFERPAVTVAGESIEHAKTRRIDLPPTRIHARPIDDNELEAQRREATERVAQARTLQRLREVLSYLEAELVSQLASTGKISLPVGPLPKGASSVSFVLKSTPSSGNG